MLHTDPTAKLDEKTPRAAADDVGETSGQDVSDPGGYLFGTSSVSLFLLKDTRGP